VSRPLGHELIVAHARNVRLIGDPPQERRSVGAQTLARLARIDSKLASREFLSPFCRIALRSEVCAFRRWSVVEFVFVHVPVSKIEDLVQGFSVDPFRRADTEAYRKVIQIA